MFYIPETTMIGRLVEAPTIWQHETNKEQTRWLRLRIAYNLPASKASLAAQREAGVKYPQGRAQYFSIGCPFDPTHEPSLKKANALVASLSKGEEITAHGKLDWNQTEVDGVKRERVSIIGDLWQVGVMPSAPQAVTEEVVEDAKVEA